MLSKVLAFLGFVNTTRSGGVVDHCISVSVFSPEWQSFKQSVELFDDLDIRYMMYGESVKSWYNNCSLGDSVHYAIDPSSNMDLLRTNLITSMWYPVDLANTWKKYGRTVEFVVTPVGRTERLRWNGLYFNAPEDYLSMV